MFFCIFILFYYGCLKYFLWKLFISEIVVLCKHNSLGQLVNGSSTRWSRPQIAVDGLANSLKIDSRYSYICGYI